MNKDRGAAHNGLTDWYWQRLSAVMLLVLIPLPFALLCAVYMGVLDQFELLEIFSHFVPLLLHTLLVFAIIVHAYFGLKLIIEDYVPAALMRVPLTGVILLIMGTIGIWWLALIWAWGG